MLNQFNKARTSGDKIDHLIRSLVDGRRGLLSLYMETVDSVVGRSFVGNAENQEHWEEFGAELMDYSAQLIFGTGPKLEEIGTKQAINRAVLAKLEQTTGSFVDFHDRYFDLEKDESHVELKNSVFAEQLAKLFEGKTLTEAERVELFENLRKDLSDLGMTLDQHFALEDQLLDFFVQYMVRVHHVSPMMALSKYADSSLESQLASISRLDGGKPPRGTLKS